jgi:hypothetical protein
MKTTGVWYEVNGKGCAHWHEFVERPDGYGFWAALSRCGMQHAVPSLVEDKYNWHSTHPDSPDIRGRECRSCLRWRHSDKKWLEAQEEKKPKENIMRVSVTFSFDEQEQRALALHRGKEELEPLDLRKWVKSAVRGKLEDIIYEVAKRED